MTDQKQPLTETKPISTVHETAIRMQQQYEKTGFYQAHDLSKVFGDPRQSVSCVVPQAYADNSNHPLPG